MVRALACALVLLVASPTLATTPAAGPDANHLYQFEKQNRNHPWLRVTGNYALVGLLGGGAAGAWLGSSFGDRFQKDVNWYTAPPPPPTPAPPTDALTMAIALDDSADADSATVDSAVAAAAVAADTISEPPASPQALAFAASIGPHDLLRVSGDFHRFQGWARVAGPAGLERILVDRDAPRDWFPHELPKRIPWSAIDEVQMRHGNAGTGALVGGVVFAVSGGLLSAAATALAESESPTPGEAALIGGAVSGLVGVAVGAGIGSAFRHWAAVYPR